MESFHGKETGNDMSNNSMTVKKSLEQLRVDYLNGDEKAFEEIYLSEIGKVFAIANSFLKNEAEAEDISQQVFLKLLETMPNVQTNLRGYLQQMTRNLCIDHMRKHKPTLFSSMGTDEQEDWFEESIEDETVVFRPEIAAQRKELIEATREIISELSDVQRLCIHMKEYEGMAYQDIADALQIPLSKVKNSIFAAKKQIKEKMQQRKLYAAAPFALFVLMYQESVQAAEIPPEVATRILDGMKGGFVQAGKEATAKAAGNALADAAKAGGDAGTEAAKEAAEGASAGTAAGVSFSAIKTAVLIVVASVIVAAGGYGIAKVMDDKKTDVQTEEYGASSETETAIQADGNETGNEVEAIAEEGKTVGKDDSEATGEYGDEQPRDDVFAQVDYAQQMTLEQQKALNYTIARVFAYQEVDNPNGISGLWGGESPFSASLTHSPDEPLFTDDKAKLYFLYAVLTETQFFDFEKDAALVQGEICEKYSIKPEKLEQLLYVLLDEKFEKMGEGLSIEPLQYKGGEYIYTVGDGGEGNSPVCEIEAVTLVAENQVEITGITYFVTWDFFDTLTRYVSPHTFRAQGYLNAESPSGITLTGIAYDENGTINIKTTQITIDDLYELATAGVGMSGEYTVTDQPESNENLGDYILPESDQRLLTEEDLANLTQEQLRYARNEIYARHGRKFTSLDLSCYFESKSWYVPSVEADDFSDECLSEIELKNLELIRRMEAQ